MPNQILLNGCAPEPMIHYLKALGIFRLVAEQCDPQVRGSWRGHAFVLDTATTRDGLVDFFSNNYRPTPIVAPWNGGSGFYDGDDTSGRDAIRTSVSPRLADYRGVISQIMRFSELPSISHLTLGEMIERVLRETAELTDKESENRRETAKIVKNSLVQFAESASLTDETLESLNELAKEVAKSDKEYAKRLAGLLQQVKKLRTVVKKLGRAAGKDVIVRACRNLLSDQAVQWIDAALVISESNSESPLLGAGGIDGHMEFTKNFMGRLQVALPELIEQEPKGKKEIRLESSKQQLAASLFGDRVVSLESASVGQFYPAGAGGANATQGVSGGSYVNPWDFILAIEGTLVLASATVRQLAAGARSRASFPFTARNSAVGYGTAVSGEKMRAEIWLPLWSRSASFAEVGHIFGEGRVQFGAAQKRVVRSGFDFARAVAELGVDRGIDAFQRYGFIERNGQANLAVPLGRFEVKERPRAALLYEVDRWLDSVRRATSDAKRTPARLIRARTNIEEAAFNLCARGEREHLQATIIALGETENDLARSAKFRDEHGLRPLSGLSDRWADECDDGSFEFEAAAALASIVSRDGGSAFRTNLEPVRLVAGNFSWTSEDTCAVWGTGALADNLAAVFNRRSIDARAAGVSHPMMWSKRFASLAAIDAFVRGDTADERFEDLLRGLALINWQKSSVRAPRPYDGIPPSLPRPYALLKLLFLPDGRLSRHGQTEPVIIRQEPVIVPLLRAGRVDEAIGIADRRLRSTGLVPLTTQFHFPLADGARLAAALLIPIGARAVTALARVILRPASSQAAA